MAATRPARKLVPEHNVETSATCQLADIYDVEEGGDLERMRELGRGDRGSTASASNLQLALQ